MAFNTPYSQSPFAMPGLKNTNGSYVPEGSKVAYNDSAAPFAGTDPAKYQGNLTRDVIRYQSGIGMENMNNGFNGLAGQMAGGFGGIGEQISDGFGTMADNAQYGGVYGQSQNQQNRNYSPQSGNWGQGGFGGSNPFMIGTY